MRLFLTGVSCVGKTTVGAKLATLLGCPFFDLDPEIERFFAMPIEPLQKQFLTMYAFRQAAAKALTSLLHREESRDAMDVLPGMNAGVSIFATPSPIEGSRVAEEEVGRSGIEPSAAKAYPSPP